MDISILGTKKVGDLLQGVFGFTDHISSQDKQHCITLHDQWVLLLNYSPEAYIHALITQRPSAAELRWKYTLNDTFGQKTEWVIEKL